MRRLLLPFLLAAACGPSAADVKQAQEAAYQTDKQVVWQAINDEMNERFREGIKVADPDKGYLETKWKPVESTQETTIGDSNQRNNTSAASVGGRTMFRAFVKIGDQGPPWRVDVDGEAAAYRPDMSMLTPYKHGAEDEPKWVPGRIDGIRVAIHNRLKQYVVKSAPHP